MISCDIIVFLLVMITIRELEFLCPETEIKLLSCILRDLCLLYGTLQYRIDNNVIEISYSLLKL